MRTMRQVRGAEGEDIAIAWLEERHWRLIARNVRIGARDEIDVVAVDPGPPTELVCVEVRSASGSAFGSPEERVDRAKVGHMYRAAMAFSRSHQARASGVGSLRVRVDLVVVERRGSSAAVRQLKRLEPA